MLSASFPFSCFEKAKRNSCPVESLKTKTYITYLNYIYTQWKKILVIKFSFVPGPLFCVWEDVGEIVEVSGTVPAVGIVKFEIPCVVLEDCCIVACVVGEDCCHVFCIELDG